MTRKQMLVVVLAVLLAVFDGYDVLSMSFVAPVISKVWAVPPSQLGLLLASALVGMAFGALGLSPLADVFGRKPVVLGGLLLIFAGSLLSAFCYSVFELWGCRFMTGLGIGLMVAMTTIIATEFVNLRRRALAVTLTTIGFGLGGISGGISAALLLGRYGWPCLFIIGAVAALILLVLLITTLPESPSFLIARKPTNGLERLNRSLTRLGQQPITQLPLSQGQSGLSYRALFAPAMAGTTVRLTAVSVLVAIPAYYFLNWLPQVVTDAGFSPAVASRLSAIAGIVGVAAGVMLRALAGFVAPARIASSAMIGFGASLAALGLVTPTIPSLTLSACGCTFFIAGSTGVFYATIAATFPALTRASGIGFVTGVGRATSAAGPLLAGWLFAAGLGRDGVSAIFAASALAGGLLLATTSGVRRPT